MKFTKYTEGDQKHIQQQVRRKLEFFGVFFQLPFLFAWFFFQVGEVQKELTVTF